MRRTSIRHHAAALVWTALLLAAGTGVGCSSLDSLRPAAGREADDVEQLKSRVLELQRKAAVTEVELERLRRRLAELEDARSGSEGRAATASPRDDAAFAPGSSSAQGGAPGPSPETEPGALNGSDFASSELPPVEPPIGSTSRPPVQAPVQAPGQDVAESPRFEERRGADAEPRILASSAAGAADRASGPSGATATIPGPLSEAAQDLYDQGYTLFHQGRYLDAETTFRRFTQSHPATELTDNASYWIGEARFARGDHEGALAAFLETAERYPQGNKVADSLLKAGQCLEVLDDPESARQSYEEVARRFPQTAAATTALERLSALR